MDIDFSKFDAYNPDVAKLQWELEMATKYIEYYYANPEFGNAERFGYSRAVVDYAPRLLTLMKLESKRAGIIDNEDLWKEINRLSEQLKKQSSQTSGTTTVDTPTLIIKDTHYHKPDPRLIMEETYE
jgi:hypothetical protein